MRGMAGGEELQTALPDAVAKGAAIGFNHRHLQSMPAQSSGGTVERCDVDSASPVLTGNVVVEEELSEAG